MPELPEVEVVVRELRERLIGERIKAIDVFWPKSLVKNGECAEKQVIQAIRRHGKYIIIELQSCYLVVHLRMTGQLIVTPIARKNEKHLQVLIHLFSGKFLHFFDSRKFGRLYLTKYPEQVMQNVGMDALDEHLTSIKLQSLMAGKTTGIKSYLLDQRHIAGLGNIYIDEVLYESGIHPLTSVQNLGADEIDVLHTTIVATLNLAVRHMGTTISDYKTVGGGFGGYQSFLHVYKKENTLCPRCNNKIVKIRVNNRGTHYCPQCQVPKK